MIVDKNEIKCLYDDYIKEQSQETYNKLWELVLLLCNYNLLKWLKRLSIQLQEEDVYDLTVDASIVIMVKIINKDNIKNFVSLSYWTTSNVLRKRNESIKKQNKINKQIKDFEMMVMNDKKIM